MPPRVPRRGMACADGILDGRAVPARRSAPIAMKPTRAAMLAIVSALLFGASTPLAKLLLREMDPWLLAGILYLGSGAGLLLVDGARRLSGHANRREASLRGVQWMWLALAILFGGVLAPGLLMYGLAGTSAAAAALLLNLEAIFTALLAWFVFGENFDRRIALGMGVIALGAVVLSWPGGSAAGSAAALIAIAAACLAWAIDNNVTRKIALTDPVQVAWPKGCVAGIANVGIALSSGSALPSADGALFAALVGFLGYGVSLALFVRALRDLGAARTGAYFSLAPFFGAVLSVVLFRQELSPALVIASLLMGLGVWLHLTERHDHEHEHLPLDHEHAHVHEEHHQHAHDGNEPPGEPHSHRHRHAPLRHRHVHYPDTHHHHPH
jgi:drug/metabolite transporter (DMT)-like permease